MRNRSFTAILIIIAAVIVAAGLTRCSSNGDTRPVKVLILSGKNNHDWQTTTPALVRIFSRAGFPEPSVTNSPDTLTYEDFKKFDVVISNWNSFPDSVFRMNAAWEEGFMKYVSEGGGVITFHAGGTSFYAWEMYHKITLGRWGKKTSHGIPTTGRIHTFSQDHPVTRGMTEFRIMDELWEKTDINPDARAIGFLSSKDVKDGHPIEEAAIFWNQVGKGRVFYTILGHDERALLNSGLQTLILRAAQWCSGTKVTIPVPREMIAENQDAKDLEFVQTDTSFALAGKQGVIWQLNFKNRYGKPYFHPLLAGNVTMTAADPPDHPWHLGLWFCWKFINGLNYWEYLEKFRTPSTGYRSEGVTEISDLNIKGNEDKSATIIMRLRYHPQDGAPVLEEERNTFIAAPGADGGYYIDEDYVFTPLADSVLLDRTPIVGEPGGQSWGGYGGISVRFSQDLTAPELKTVSDSLPCPDCPWTYTGFTTLTGKKAGIAIFRHKDFTTPVTSWYIITDAKIPFWYFSPAALYRGPVLLRKGENLHLRYRTWIIPGEATVQELSDKYNEFIHN